MENIREKYRIKRNRNGRVDILYFDEFKDIMNEFYYEDVRNKDIEDFIEDITNKLYISYHSGIDLSLNNIKYSLIDKKDVCLVHVVVEETLLRTVTIAQPIEMSAEKRTRNAEDIVKEDYYNERIILDSDDCESAHITSIDENTGYSLARIRL